MGNPYFLMSFFILIFFSLITAIFCTHIASEKGYDALSWFILGFLFSFIALIAVAGMPDRQTRKYLRLIGENQNAIPKNKVVKRTIKSKDKMEFTTEADANKEEVYRNLSNLLMDSDRTRKDFYSLKIDSYEFNDSLLGGKELIVMDSDKNILITLTSIQYGDKRTWEVDSL